MPGDKVTCVHPVTGRRLQIDRHTYELFSSAIINVLKGHSGGLTFSEMVEGITKELKNKKIRFEGSVPWYAVSIKQDMETRKLIVCDTVKGKKLHLLSRVR